MSFRSARPNGQKHGLPRSPWGNSATGAREQAVRAVFTLSVTFRISAITINQLDWLGV